MIYFLRFKVNEPEELGGLKSNELTSQQRAQVKKQSIN